MTSLVKKIMKLIFWLKKRKTFKEEKKLNLKNIFNFVDAQYNHWLSTNKFLSGAPHIEEISLWRLEQIKEKSPECLKESAYCSHCNELGDLDQECSFCNEGLFIIMPDIRCRQCGCNTVEKSFEMDGCNSGCYPARQSPEEWNKFKQTNNITICYKLQQRNMI